MTDILFEIILEKTGKESYTAKLYYNLDFYGNEISNAVSKMIEDIRPFWKLAKRIPSELPNHNIIEISRIRGDVMMWRGIYKNAKTVESYAVYGYGWKDEKYEDLVICKLADEEQYCYTLREIAKPDISTGIIITANEILKAFYVASHRRDKKTEIFTLGKIIRIIL